MAIVLLREVHPRGRTAIRIAATRQDVGLGLPPSNATRYAEGPTHDCRSSWPFAGGGLSLSQVCLQICITSVVRQFDRRALHAHRYGSAARVADRRARVDHRV